jgi:hypothetical protein
VANTAIVGVSNVLTAPTLGAAFGAFSTNNNRGITGLALQGTNLGVGLDNGAGNVNSVRMFNAGSGTLTWSTGGTIPDATRRGNGVAFDPGFNGAGTNQGLAYMSIGSGRRHLLNTGTGIYINGQNAGAIVNFSPVSTTWRDLAFDPATGDLYTRESNRIGKAVRNGNNTFTSATSTAIGGLTTATGVDNQNIAFANTTLYGNLLFANNRTGVGAGQSLSSVVRAFDTNGNAQTITFENFTPGTGNGAYDFSFDAGTQTLAMTDFSNRRLYIFAMGSAAPEPSTLALLALAPLGALLLRRKRH